MFLIIDGSSMLVTNYYGNLPKSILFEKDPEKRKALYSNIMHSSDGTYTNAVYGTLRTLLKIIDKQKPEYIAVAFDKSRNTFRRNLYPEYKANRGEVPEPLKQQFVLMENLLSDIGIPVFYSDEYEADDIAGTLAKKYSKDTPVRIMTKDHDYLQLVDNNSDIRVWMVQTKQEKCDQMFESYGRFLGITKETVNLPDKVFEYTEEIVYGEERVWPNQIIDLKGIVGDTSDNIPGIKGVSSAAPVLLSEYETFEGIYEAIESTENIEEFWKDYLGIKKGNLKKFLADGAKDVGLLSKKLATIVDVPDDVFGKYTTIEQFRTNIDKDALSKNCKQLDFKSIIV